MKKFKNIIYIAILSLLVVSCEDNTESVTNPGEFSGDGITEVKVGFTDNNLSTELTEGEKVTYSVGMPIKIKGDVKVSINITSTDGDAEATYPSSVTIVEGVKTAYFDVIPKDDGVVETESFKVEITNVEVSLNNSQENYFVHLGDNSRTISVKDIPTPIVTTAGDFVFNFTWSGATNDLDCRLVNNPPTLQYDTGYSTTPGETVTLVDAVPDGDYLFRVRPWTVNDTSIDYNIEIVAPTESRDYSGNFMNLTGGWSMEFVVLEINKSTNGAVVTYTINQL